MLCNVPLFVFQILFLISISSSANPVVKCKPPPDLKPGVKIDETSRGIAANEEKSDQPDLSAPKRDTSKRPVVPPRSVKQKNPPMDRPIPGIFFNKSHPGLFSFN